MSIQALVCFEGEENPVFQNNPVIQSASPYNILHKELIAVHFLMVKKKHKS